KHNYVMIKKGATYRYKIRNERVLPSAINLKLVCDAEDENYISFFQSPNRSQIFQQPLAEVIVSRLLNPQEYTVRLTLHHCDLSKFA
ncbi:hypothetical protein L9F63_024038, partial [Diploptera punctata]